jgi:hypothetical protein
MQQQQASAVPKLVQRLRRSIKHKDTPQQHHLVLELLGMTNDEPQVDAGAARLQVLQQTGICAALQQLLQMRNPMTVALAAQLVGTLGQAGPQAADKIAAQPGIIPGLARLLQPSSERAACFAGDVCMAVRAIWHLSSSKVAAERLAAEPGVFAGLVGVLTATADEEAVSAAPTASFALCQTTSQISSSRVMRMLQQQPGALAALSELLNSEHSRESQGQALSVLHAVVRAVSADRAAAARIVQQIAFQPGTLQHLVRLLRSRVSDPQGAQQDPSPEKLALCLVNYLVILGGAQIDVNPKYALLITPEAIPAIVRMLDHKDKDSRALAASLLWCLSTGGCRWTGWQQDPLLCCAASCRSLQRQAPTCGIGWRQGCLLCCAAS